MKMKWYLKIAYDREDGELWGLDKPMNSRNASIECPDCGKVIIEVPKNLSDFYNPMSRSLPRQVECNCEGESDED